MATAHAGVSTEDSARSHDTVNAIVHALASRLVGQQRLTTGLLVTC